jgi:hypothetical protein
MSKKVIIMAFLAAIGLFSTSCATTEIIESPKTAYVANTGEKKIPAIIWTSRTLTQKFDYLGQIKVKSLSYDGALERLSDAGSQLGADAIIDVHYQPVGFLTSFHAFAIKYK